MTGLRGRWLPLSVLVGAVAALVASLVWMAGYGPGPGGPAGMMGVVSGEGPVTNMADAERAAARFGDRWDLQVGEVMEFSNGYYAKLLDGDGSLATEVLIDPGNGLVHLEFGPAMMWNTGYGMVPARGAVGPAAVGGEDAVRIADRWLGERRAGLHAGGPDRFPGYYTLHTLRDDQVVGMLSVNATTGAVWYHSWHGRFIRMQEHPETDSAPSAGAAQRRHGDTLSMPAWLR